MKTVRAVVGVLAFLVLLLVLVASIATKRDQANSGPDLLTSAAISTWIFLSAINKFEMIANWKDRVNTWATVAFVVVLAVVWRLPSPASFEPWTLLDSIGMVFVIGWPVVDILDLVKVNLRGVSFFVQR